MAAAGNAFNQAGVAAVYCVHGTFCGDDVLGLFTELEGWAPSIARPLRRWSKRAIDAAIGETGNYTRAFAERMEAALSVGTNRLLPVRLFHWSSLNHHVGRADGAVRLFNELATFAEQHAQQHVVVPPPPQGEGNRQQNEQQVASRVLLWAHSHGGNVLALLTNLLGADAAARHEFFHASRTFFRPWLATRSDMPHWERAEQILADPQHPVRKLKLDVVAYGTPVRYGWDAGAYHNLLHVINHRPQANRGEHRVPYPPWPHHVLAAEHGDYIQQVGVAGTNFPPLPIALRTFLADWRLGNLLQKNLGGWVRSRLKHGMRVHDEGTTLLIDYDDPHRMPWRHALGHAPYTRSHWLPLHCELAAEHFYSSRPSTENQLGGKSSNADST